MKKTASRKILWVLTFGLIGWVRVAIEDILLNGWDVFFNNITHWEYYFIHWEHYLIVYILVAVGILGGYIYNQRLEGLQLIITLQEKENLLTTVMEATPEYIWMVDTKFRIQYLNRTGSTHTREALIGKPIYTLMPLEMQQREKQHLEQAIKADSSYKYETESLFSDGSIDLFENIAVPLKFGNKVVGLVISSRNITEERRIGESLKDSESKYQILVENSMQGIAIIQDEKYLYVNPAFARTVGYSVEEMLNFSSEDVWDLIHPDDKKELEQRNTDLCDGLHITPVQIFRYIRSDGSIKWVESQLTVIQYNGQPAIQIFELDITERKQAELRLQESERNVGLIIASLQVGIVLVDRDSHKIADINPIAEQMIGGSKEEIINSICHKFICPKEEGNCPITDQGLIISQNETILLNMEGESIPIMKSVIPITLSEKEYLLESFMDISILKESEERFRVIFDQALDGILLADLGTKRFHTGNTSICQMLGYSIEEIRSLEIKDIHPKEHLSYILEQFEKQKRKELKIAKDIPVKRKDGSIFYADINSSPVTLSGRKYLLGLFRDITIRKQAEEALTKARDYLESEVEIATRQLREEKQRIEAIIETSPNAIVVLDNSGTITLSNHAFNKLYLRINDSHPPRDLNIIQKAEGALITELKAIFSSKDFEERIIEPIKGLHLQLLTSRFGETDSTHSGQIIEFFDVTPFIEFEKAQKKFITTISHELRTPITSISLSIGNLKKYRSKMTEEQYEYLLNAVEENTKLLGEIVEGATLLSKIQSGEYELNNQSYSLSNLIEILLKLTKSEAKLKNIEIIVESESEIEMIGDWLKIETVLKVLFSNAIKFSPKNGVVKISVENNYFGKYNEGRVKGTLIKINDKGPGIKEEDIQKIFEPFHKTKETRDIQGLGLGLHLAQKIAKIHEGEIFVESEFGKGSTFFLFLPYMSKSKELE